MSPPRPLLGLSIGGGFESADAVLVRAAGAGLGLRPEVSAAVRSPLPPELRDAGRRAVRGDGPWPADAEKEVGESLARAATQAAQRAGIELRRVQAAGWVGATADALPGAADRFAEATGVTTLSGFPGRDRAAGGSGRLVSAAADFLLFSHPSESRALVHLGGVTTMLVLPAGGKLSDVRGGEVGPGNRLLDALTRLGTRGRDGFDSGGTRAVQGRCLEPLLERWRSGFTLARRAGRPLSRAPEGGDFVREAFRIAGELGGTLPDLLCTATHFAADCVGRAAREWAPGCRVLVSGGGVRNGMLWQRLDAALAPLAPERLDSVGVSPFVRPAAGAAVLAALTLDGVNGSVPFLTGAGGSRLLGRIVPGDARNWESAIAWMARLAADYGATRRAA